MNLYRRLFEVNRELARLRAKYEKPETDEARENRQAAWLYESIMAGDPEPLAVGALVTGPADMEALTAGWQPDDAI